MRPVQNKVSLRKLAIPFSHELSLPTLRSGLLRQTKFRQRLFAIRFCFLRPPKANRRRGASSQNLCSRTFSFFLSLPTLRSGLFRIKFCFAGSQNLFFTNFLLFPFSFLLIFFILSHKLTNQINGSFPNIYAAGPVSGT